MLITIPRGLREKLGEEGANGLVELLNSQAQNSGDSITTFVEEKFERRLSDMILCAFLGRIEWPSQHKRCVDAT